MFDVEGLEYFSCKDGQNLITGSVADTCLDKTCEIQSTKERIQTLYKHVFNAAYPSMAFIGIALTDLPFLCYDLQVRWTFSVWTGFRILPSTEDMITDSDNDYASWRKLGLTELHNSHLLSDRQWEYFHQLAINGATRPPDCVVKKLHNAICYYKANNSEEYKSYQFAVTGHSSFIKLSGHKSKFAFVVKFWYVNKQFNIIKKWNDN